MQPLVYSRIDLQPQVLEAHFLRLKIVKRHIECNVMQSRRLRAELLGSVKEGKVLGMTAIALCDLEEYKTLFPPKCLKPDDFFVKLVHGVEVLDADGHFA